MRNSDRESGRREEVAEEVDTSEEEVVGEEEDREEVGDRTVWFSI